MAYCKIHVSIPTGEMCRHIQDVYMHIKALGFYSFADMFLFTLRVSSGTNGLEHRLAIHTQCPGGKGYKGDG